MNETLTCDVAIIGAGTAGLAAERAARSAGARTLLIDPAFAGTTCALVGCMPSKLLIAASRAAHAARGAQAFGISTCDVTIDGAAVMERVREERDRFARLTREGAIADVPEDNRVQAKARFVSKEEMALDNAERVCAKSFVIATGSSPDIPEAFGDLGEYALTSDDLFELVDLPRSVAVIGSGAIGLEMAQALARLGVRVTLFEEAERLSGIGCDATHQAVEAMMRRDMDVRLGARAKATRSQDGVALEWDGATSGRAGFDRVLLAVGRSPNTQGLGLEAAGLECDGTGVPIHDRATMRCADSNIFLAGDVAADIAVLHEASHDGSIAGRNAAAAPVALHTRRMVPFTLTFTDPPIATIGRTQGEDAVVASADYGNQGRARVENRNEGCVTLFADPSKGTLIGASLCAPGGEHLAHMLAWAIEREETASALLNMPIYHPTLEEGLEGALRTICTETPAAIRDDQDRIEPPGF
jgi:dihydrolipoamide dehydrogenase